MIKLLPVFAIIAVSILLFVKAFDKFIELVVFFHSLCSYRNVFDDYEAELIQLENDGEKGKTGRMDTDDKVLAEVRKSLEEELSAYRELVNSNLWKYRCWRLFFREHTLVRTISDTDNKKVAIQQD